MGALDGKTALVTGGGRGIGRAIVERFVAEGAKVMTCGRSGRPPDLPESVLWQRLDVADSASVRQLAARLADDGQGLDVLVNNAGVQIEKTLLQTEDEDWDRLMGVNAKGVFLCCRELLPLLQPRSGSIINIGSISGQQADPGLALYNASKAFVHGLTRSIAVDHGPQVRCNAICPGWIMTDMASAAFAVAEVPERAEQDALRRHPVGRFGRPQDVANLALWLASDQAAFASGQLFTLDGGMSAASPLNPRFF